MRRFSGRAAFMVGLTAVVGSMLWSENSGAATIDFTVEMSWSATTPACDGLSAIVCSGVGSQQLTSGMQVVAESLPTTLDLQPVDGEISQEDGDPVRIGVLRYCNGETADGTDIENATLLVDFEIPGVAGGSGQTTDVATLFLTINDPGDPVASADTLFLASDPTRSHSVQENDCLDIELLGKVTVEPDLVIILGPEVDPSPASTTTTNTSSSTTSTTSSTASSTVPSSTSSAPTTTVAVDPALCPAAYFGKCAPEIRSDWNCPDSSNNALPASWTNVPVNPDLPLTEQDPWGLDGAKGPEYEGRANVGCESTTTSASVRSATTVASGSAAASNSTGTGATGLAATGGNAGPLALMALGLVLLGGSASQTQIGRRWYATADDRVRYTIDSRRRIR